MLSRFKLVPENRKAFRLLMERKRACQKLHSLSREALAQLLELAHSLFSNGRSTAQVLEVLMPA